MTSANDAAAAPSNDNHTEDPRTVRIKRIRFRAWHRGIKEMDLLMGGFADLYLKGMSDAELDAFERIMDGDGDPGAPLPVRLGSEFLSFIVPLSGTWLVVNAPKLIEAYKGQQPAAGADTQPELEASPVPETATSPFLEEMPPHLGKDLVALSAELHYLRIHTAVGEALVLYSFGKALDQLADWPGMVPVGLQDCRAVDGVGGFGAHCLNCPSIRVRAFR